MLQHKSTGRLVAKGIYFRGYDLPLDLNPGPPSMPAPESADALSLSRMAAVVSVKGAARRPNRMQSLAALVNGRLQANTSEPNRPRSRTCGSRYAPFRLPRHCGTAEGRSPRPRRFERPSYNRNPLIKSNSRASSRCPSETTNPARRPPRVPPLDRRGSCRGVRGIGPPRFPDSRSVLQGLRGPLRAIRFANAPRRPASDLCRAAGGHSNAGMPTRHGNL